MKKLTGLLIIGTAMLCLAACSGKNNTQTASEDTGSGIWDDYGAKPASSSDNFWAQNGVGTDSGSSNSTSDESGTGNFWADNGVTGSDSGNGGTGNFWADNGVGTDSEGGYGDVQDDDSYYSDPVSDEQDEPAKTGKYEGSPILGRWENEFAVIPYDYEFYADGSYVYCSQGGGYDEGTFEFDGTRLAIHHKEWEDTVLFYEDNKLWDEVNGYEYKKIY